MHMASSESSVIWPGNSFIAPPPHRVSAALTSSAEISFLNSRTPPAASPIKAPKTDPYIILKFSRVHMQRSYQLAMKHQ